MSYKAHSLLPCMAEGMGGEGWNLSKSDSTSCYGRPMNMLTSCKYVNSDLF